MESRFNAFGEVTTEFDDRVKQRMQAMVDYYKSLPVLSGCPRPLPQAAQVVFCHQFLAL
jgi:hypothetical protein